MPLPYRRVSEVHSKGLRDSGAMASFLVCLPSRSKLNRLALTYDCVQRIRAWGRVEGGKNGLLHVVSTLGCVNYRSLERDELEDLVKLLAQRFEDALDAVRRRVVDSSVADSSPFHITEDEDDDVKPDLGTENDLKPDGLPHDFGTRERFSSRNDDENIEDPADSDDFRVEVLPESPKDHLHGTKTSRLDKTFFCRICPKKFTAAKSLHRHSNRAHGVSEISHDNSDGSLSAKTPESDGVLRGSANPFDQAEPESNATESKSDPGSPPNKKEKNYACSVCSKKFATATLADRHRERVHREKRVRKEKVDANSVEKPVAINEETAKQCGATQAETIAVSEEPTTLESLVESLNLPVEEYEAEGYGFESRGSSESMAVSAESAMVESERKDAHARNVDSGAITSETTPTSSESTQTQNLCPVCGAQFVVLAELQRHEAEAHQDLSISKITPGSEKRRRRKTDESKPPKVFECNRCGKQFKDKHYLRKHDNVHTRSKLYVCHLCGKSFNQNSGLYTHKKLHLDNAPFKCDVEGCGKSFTTKNSLVSHSSEHTGIRPFVCEVCEKAFGNRRTLLRHREIHFEISKAFQCSFCKKTFRRKADLDIHERIHTGIKPFICSFSCGRAFTQKQSLTEHERIHKGERPFACDQCGKSFTQKSTLTKHKSTHKFDVQNPELGDSREIEANP